MINMVMMSHGDVRVSIEVENVHLLPAQCQHQPQRRNSSPRPRQLFLLNCHTHFTIFIACLFHYRFRLILEFVLHFIHISFHDELVLLHSFCVL